ncbi:MAG: MBL fold metallo-hydrolase [Leptospiraceae bacterium]|nr:MBL fold metallo-hydrolase [Leptospiraceae bacterium]
MEIKRLKIYHQEHHTQNGFRNPYPSIERDPVKSFFWVFSKILSGDEKEKIFPADFVKLSKEEIQQEMDSYRFYWIGHSTVLIVSPKYYFITDPHFSERASPVSFAGPKRQRPPAISLEDIPKIDFVLISHNHYDHLDEKTVREIDKKFKPLFFVPLRVGNHLNEWGISNYVELDWWEYVELDGIQVFCTPARHFSARSLFDRNETLWAGWYVKDRDHDFDFYFAGDTGYERFFREIREEIGKPKVALIPIGAFEPRWFMQEVHLDPQEAFRAFLDLDAEILFPIHWGTFYLAEEPMNLPPKLLKETYENWRQAQPNPAKEVAFLKIGEKIKVSFEKRYAHTSN